MKVRSGIKAGPKQKSAVEKARRGAGKWDLDPARTRTVFRDKISYRLMEGQLNQVPMTQQQQLASQPKQT